MIKAWFILRKDSGLIPDQEALLVAHGTDLIHMDREQIPFYGEWTFANGSNFRKVIMRVPNIQTIDAVVSACKSDGVPYRMLADNVNVATGAGNRIIAGMVVLPYPEDRIPVILRAK
jgi:hypothetical protein